MQRVLATITTNFLVLQNRRTIDNAVESQGEKGEKIAPALFGRTDTDESDEGKPPVSKSGGRPTKHHLGIY